MPDMHKQGQDIGSSCGKCRLNLEHTIMEMAGTAIARVRCKSCGGWHKFRDPLAVKKVRKPRVKESAGEAATAEIVWAAGLAEAKGKERDYRMDAIYRVGDIINHQTFGKGIVTKLYADKCDMLFKDKARLMAAANK